MCTSWALSVYSYDGPACDGLVGTFFSVLTRPGRDCARVPLTLARLLLFHRRLHGTLRTTRAEGPVKTACESEQTLSVQRYMRRKNSDSFLTREAAGVKTRLFSRATASRERCTAVDAVSMRARTPPRSPIRARATKCLLGDDASREIACDACEPTATSKSYKCANTLIDLVSSSSIDDTVSVLTESVVLTSTFLSTRPSIYKPCTAHLARTPNGKRFLIE